MYPYKSHGTRVTDWQNIQLSSAASPSDTVFGFSDLEPQFVGCNYEAYNKASYKYKITPSTPEEIKQPLHQSRKTKYNENNINTDIFTRTACKEKH